MPRTARLVMPGYPHHVTQRGNRRQQTFFGESDYIAYLELIRNLKDEAGVQIWAYCLMPNHVHFIAVPTRADSLASLYGKAHARYARRVNRTNQWLGHLWQERFHSAVMDESYAYAAARYVELNPVRAGLCKHPEDWPWSSAQVHLQGGSHSLLNDEAIRQLVPDWRQYLAQEADHVLVDGLRQRTRTGRPAGDLAFLVRLEELTGRDLRRRRVGRPKARGEK